MDVEKELERIRKDRDKSHFSRKPHYLEVLAIDEESCRKLAEYFDFETGEECSPVGYIQQALLEIRHDQKIERLERKLEAMKSEKL